MIIVRRLCAIALASTAAAWVPGEDTPIAVPPAAATDAGDSALPQDLRDRVRLADAAAERDPAEAYRLLQDLRADPRFERLSAEAASIDRQRNQLAARLAADLLKQGQAQEHDARAALAEKFYRQALAFRASSASELERFYATEANAAQLGGADEAKRRLQSLDQDSEAPETLRWKLRAIGSAATWAELDEQQARLARLVRAAGAADDDVRAFTQAGANAATRLLSQPRSTDATASAHADPILGAATAILGPGDRAVAELRTAAQRTHRREALLRLGAHEQAIVVRVAAWRPTLSGSFHARATPASTVGGFANASASSGLDGDAIGTRIELQWLREPSPLRPDGLVFGGMLAASSTRFTTDLVLADADTGGASLQNQHFSSAIGVRTIGVDAILGWRFTLGGEDGAWTLQPRIFGGLHALSMSYGTRRGAVDGSAPSRTLDGSGYLSECGLDLETAWRVNARWAVVGTLGYLYAQGSIDSSSGSARFVNSAGTTTTSGTYEERFESLRMAGPYLGIGVRAAF